MNVPLLKRLSIGFRRHPGLFFATVFIVYSGLWTLLESLAHVLPFVEPRGWMVFSVMALAGVPVGLWHVSPSQAVGIRIKAIDTTVEIEFGDLFESHNSKVIAVTEFFDSEIGVPVAPRSVHGQLIDRCFGGRSDVFDSLVESELSSEPYTSVVRAKGKSKRYSIGTTPVIQVGDDRFFLCALCHTDPATSKAYCDIPTLWKALERLWLARLCLKSPVSRVLFGQLAILPKKSVRSLAHTLTV